MATSKESCGLVGTSRIDIFREIGGVDAVSNQINEEIFGHIASKQYDQFVEFCKLCEEDKEAITSLSCSVDSTNTLVFQINYKQENGDPH